MNSIASFFKETGTLKTFRAKTPILFQGEIPRDLFIVLDGIVRAYTITSSGEERVIGLYGKGSAFPLSWAIGEASTTLYYYEAVADSRVISVRKADFKETIVSNNEAAQALLSLVGHDYTSAQLRITGLTQSRTVEKLAYTFYYLMFRFGLERPNDNVLINMKLNQTLLANLIGQTREGTARNLKVLTEQGVVSYEGSSYTVNQPKLMGMLGEDSFRELVEATER